MDKCGRCRSLACSLEASAGLGQACRARPGTGRPARAACRDTARSLSGKEDGQFPGAWAATEEDAPSELRRRRSSRPGSRSADRACSSKRGQVRALALDDEKQSALGRRIPRLPRLGGASAELRPLRVRRPLAQAAVRSSAGVRARESEDLRIAVPVDGFLVGAGFFKDAVEIAAAEAESADGGAARMRRRRQPRPGFGVDVERTVAGSEAARSVA